MSTGLILSLVLLAGALIWYGIEKSRRKSHAMDGGIHTDITLPHEAPFELYSNAFSHCSRKARLAMAELGIAYIHRPIDLVETGQYQTISPAYLKVNPAGILPVLVHNGHPIYESDDILKYAAAHAGPDAPQLTPDDPQKLAAMNEWLDYCNITNDDPLGNPEGRLGPCVPALTMPIFVTMMQYISFKKLIPGLLFHPDKKRPFFFSAAKLFGLRGLMRAKPLTDLVGDARDAARNHLKKLDDALGASQGDWILGDQFTLADITLASALLRIAETGWLDYFKSLDGLPHVAAYYERLQARPSWQTAITDKQHHLVEQGSNDLKALLKDDQLIKSTLQPLAN